MREKPKAQVSNLRYGRLGSLRYGGLGCLRYALIFA